MCIVEKLGFGTITTEISQICVYIHTHKYIPENISYSKQPNDHRSLALEKSSPFITSGAVYIGDPTKQNK